MTGILIDLLLVLLGYLLRGAVQGRWRRNPKPHHAADTRHCWLEITGRWHAFTDSDLAKGLARAETLTPFLRLPWVGRALLALTAAALAWLMLP